MNNENSNLEPVQNNVGIPEMGATTPVSDPPTFQTIDPTADFQTIDPTAVEQDPMVSTEPATSAEVLMPTETTTAPAPVTESVNPAENAPAPTVAPAATMQPPKANPVDMSTFEAANTRYNPVTGEEMNMDTLMNGGTDAGAVNNEEKLKKVKVDYKPTGKGNSILLIFFFIGLIAFVIFLPEITEMIALRRSGNLEVKEIVNGTLVCELVNDTTNLTRTMKREFKFKDNKLQSAKFSTIIRGDVTQDEEILDTYNAQCQQIRDNVENLQGITVSCEYTAGKITEKESFDFSIYDFQNVEAAYTEAGGSVIEFQYEQEIDRVQTLMQQGGFKCEKKEG